MRYYLIAGEASGDLHGAALMAAIAGRDRLAEFRFRGGDRMAAVGGTLFRHYRETAVMGLTEVAAKAGRILADIKATREDILNYSPDVLILIDYPGFNLKMAEFAHRHGFKVFYYIPPKLWARGEGRIRKIRRYVDEVFVIFPFETKYFADLGVKAIYCGNPLLDTVGEPQQPEADSKIIALLPGSRKAELKWLMPRFAELEKRLSRNPRWAEFRLVIGAAPNLSDKEFRKWLPADTRMELRRGDTAELLREARAAIISSGTASLEAALTATPQVVCYGFSRLTYAIAKLIVKVKYISLANLIADKLIYKELIQSDSSVENILVELERLTFDEACRSEMKRDYARLRELMGEPGAADRLAEAMISRLSLANN